MQRWQQLDAQQHGSAEEEDADAVDAELDDDPQDSHSHVGSGSDEAETIHSWGEHVLHFRQTKISRREHMPE